ncbi:ras-related protein Rab-36 isoform X6 [Lutra lutra]|uniref:ras-related protein Rab-36 isoform X6 n=1 Tax=Lutra lutra TaxID=9657 RepID=UPI001FD363C6|nr:ras-related protein Rab-36 isoform X6 [Lutra lutra]
MLLPQEALVATVTALPNYVWDSFRCEPRPDPVPDARDSSDVGGSRGALVAMVIAATGPTRPGRAASRVFATSAGHSARMRSSLTPLGPPVSRDRIITSFPKWYTPDACLQLKEHFHGQVSATCQRRNTGTVGLRLSKVVVVGDLYVGKTSLIHRFCKNVFDRDYKATIGVDFEIERFEIAGIPYSLQMGEREGILQPRSCPGVRAIGSTGLGEEEQHPAPGRRWRPHPCVQTAGPGAGEQACTLKLKSTSLLSQEATPLNCSPVQSSLGNSFCHDSDVRPSALLTLPASSDSLPGSLCPPGSFLMSQTRYP